MLKKIARTLSLISAFFMGLTLLPWLKGVPGSARTIAGSASPVLGLLGTLGTTLGTLTKDPAAVVAGTVGTFTAVRHMQDSTQHHEGMRQAFGPRWYATIPPTARRQWLRERWNPVPLGAPVLATRTLDVDYCTDVECGPVYANIWEPAPGIRRSGLGVLMVHGGAWHYGNRNEVPALLLNYLAAQGHTVMDIDYRLPPTGHFFQQIADIHRALAWMHATLDIDKVVTYGHSAGAHLSLLAAYAPDDLRLVPADVAEANRRIDGAVAFYPPADFELFVRDWVVHGDERFEPGWVSTLAERVLTPLLRRTGSLPQEGSYMYIGQILPNFLGGTPFDARTMYDLASPIHHVTPAAPPTLILHGENDNLVERQHSRNLYHKLQACGVPSVFTTFPRTGHGFDQTFMSISPAGRSALYDVERFLARIAYAPKASSA